MRKILVQKASTIIHDVLYHASVCGHWERAPVTEFASQLIVQHAHTQAVRVFAPHDAYQGTSGRLEEA